MGRDTVPGFGAKLRELREAAGLTQTQLGERAGTHFTAVAKIETDERAPSLRLGLALARALGVSVYVLAPAMNPRGNKK